MRIRLIQPPLVQPRYRQLTLPVLAAEFKAHGLDIEVCDENIEDVDLSDVDLVGVTCHVYNAPRAFELAALFRERGVPVLMGGTFPTVAPALVAPHCDSVVVGELEGQTADIVRDARAGRLAPTYRSDAPPPLRGTLAPDFSVLRKGQYLRFNFPLEVSRGCRFACKFCTSPLLFRKARTRRLDEIARDLAQYDHGLIELVDVNFLNDTGFFREVMPLLRAAPTPGWTGQTTLADLAADAELPEELARSGCRAVFIGLESMSPAGLRTLDKAWSRPEQFFTVAKRLRDAGVLVQAGIVVGLDTDEPGTLDRTADALEEARVQTVSFTWLHYYPGTAPYEDAKRRGVLHSDDWRDYDGNHAVLTPARMTIEALEGELSRMLRRFYGPGSVLRRGLHRGVLSNPSQVLHHGFVNAAMQSYYASGPGDDGDARHRYMGRPKLGDRVERGFANAGSRLMDRVMRWGRE